MCCVLRLDSGSLSGQALELVNQIMKKIKGTNGRYSENHRTGAKPSKKMGVGRIEQLVKRMTSKSKAKTKMQGTRRQSISWQAVCFRTVGTPTSPVLMRES